MHKSEKACKSAFFFEERLDDFKYLKRVFVLLIFCFVGFSGQAIAQDATCNGGTCSFPYFGTSSGDTTKLWANSSTGQNDFLTLQAGGTGTVLLFDSSGNQSGSRSISSGGTVNFPSGTKGFSLRSSGSEIHAIRATTDNSNSRVINFGASSNPPPSGGGGGNDNTGCFCGCFFESDGWDAHMGELRRIRNAIPPAPDWNNVGNTMRDKIVPAMINGMDNLLGRAPSPPSARRDLSISNINAPSAIRLPQPNTPGAQETPPVPTRNEPTIPRNRELEDAGFDSDRIKNEAPEIEFEEPPEDESWNINNPVDSLPDLDIDYPDLGQDSDWDQGHENTELETSEPDINAGEPGKPVIDAGEPTKPNIDAGTPGTPVIDAGEPNAPNIDAGTPGSPNIDAGMPGSPSEGGNMPEAPGNPNQGGFNPPMPGGGTGGAPMPGGGNDSSPPTPGNGGWFDYQYKNMGD